jgi:A/G-specific adenine glycosylase
MTRKKAPDHKRGRRTKASVSDALLAWYYSHRRDLPWRAKPGEPSDPYRVWLSEIMLQQTTVAAVAPYFRKFLERWPNVKALAAASQDQVLGAWAGLGYYSRARNLHRAAQTVARDYGGRFPETSEGLRALPGVGAYTAAAIAAIAHGESVAAMDANAERVIARLFAVEDALPKAKARLALLAEPLVPEQRAGDFAQALMDLGAMICVPKRPLCAECPLARECRGRAIGIAEQLPRKTAERARPTKRGAAFVAFDAAGAVYLVRRPEKGLLGAMLQPPMSDWVEAFPERAVVRKMAPFAGRWIKRDGFVRHGFTHFVLELEVWVSTFGSRPKSSGIWLSPRQLNGSALPTVMRKVIAHATDDNPPLLETLSLSRARASARDPDPAGPRRGPRPARRRSGARP